LLFLVLVAPALGSPRRDAQEGRRKKKLPLKLEKTKSLDAI
jgi:hypothetical protein